MKKPSHLLTDLSLHSNFPAISLFHIEMYSYKYKSNPAMLSHYSHYSISIVIISLQFTPPSYDLDYFRRFLVDFPSWANIATKKLTVSIVRFKFIRVFFLFPFWVILTGVVFINWNRFVLWLQWVIRRHHRRMRRGSKRKRGSRGLMLQLRLRLDIRWETGHSTLTKQIWTPKLNLEEMGSGKDG